MESIKRYEFGKWIDCNNTITVSDIDSILKKGRDHQNSLATYPLHQIEALLERLSEKWNNVEYHRRKRLVEVLPTELGFSRQMVELGLSRVASILNSKVLMKKTTTEFNKIPRVNGHYYNESTSTAIKWQPLGVLLHVLAGNGFLGALSSLLEGLLTGNISILKVASGKTSFLYEFLSSLISCDEDGIISKSIATISYNSSETNLIEKFKKGVDGIVIWGGEQAVQGYRNNLPARTKIIVFGPKLSMGLITKKGFEKYGVETIAKNIATEISIWDQSSCSAPQLIYIENEMIAKEIIDQLHLEMEIKQKELPIGVLNINSAIEIQKIRGKAIVDEFYNCGYLKESTNGLKWTLYIDKDLKPVPSPLFRTIRFIPYSNIDQLKNNFLSIKGNIQTIGIVSDLDERIEIFDHLGEVGVVRMMDLGKMSYGEVDDPHDGAYDLPQLMNLIFNRFKLQSQAHAYIDCISNKERWSLVDNSLSELSYRRKEYDNLSSRLKNHKLENRSDLSRLSIQTKHSHDFNDNTASGGYVSHSGGTTGKPCFSVYNHDEWIKMMDRSKIIFSSLGITKNDRVANLLTAGNLKGGFVSFDHVNSLTGCQNFCFASTSPVDSFVEAWRKFKINIVQGMPSYIISFLKQAKELEADLNIEKIIFGGGLLSQDDRDWLTNVIHVKSILGIYGANDGGPIGFQCPNCQQDEYHLVDDYNYIEIVNDEGELLPEGSEGHILLTSLKKYNSPLIRYEIGDLGIIMSQRCLCNRTTRKLKFRGRIADKIKISNSHFSHYEVNDYLKDMQFSQLQIKLTDEKIHFLFEASELHFNSKNCTKRLSDFMKKKQINTMIDVQIVNKIERVTNSVKNKTLIDLRGLT